VVSVLATNKVLGLVLLSEAGEARVTATEGGSSAMGWLLEHLTLIGAIVGAVGAFAVGIGAYRDQRAQLALTRQLAGQNREIAELSRKTRRQERRGRGAGQAQLGGSYRR
jgi:hypothetical protein